MKHGDRIRQAALTAGVEIWAAHGVSAVSARGVGQAIGLTHGGILYHFGTTAALVEAVASEAVRVGEGEVVRQLIATKHPAVKDMTPGVKAHYLSDC